jgi:hypothetical protein
MHGKCPGLLVSVRNACEARTALRFGADLIDIKEPYHGPLGRPTPKVAAAVAHAVGTEREVSIALGELADLEIGPYLPLFQLPAIHFAKIGLAGIAGHPGWWARLLRVWERLPVDLHRVGVIYADWQAAGAPRPEQALKVFADGGCSAVLFDTFTKDGRSLVDFAASEQLADWTHQARLAAPMLVLSGSLTTGLLHSVREYAPDYVAVRGSVCRRGRRGQVSGPRIRRFASALKRTFGPISP